MFFIFSTPEFIRNLWQFKTVVFLHWCLIRAVPLPVSPSLILWIKGVVYTSGRPKPWPLNIRARKKWLTVTNVVLACSTCWGQCFKTFYVRNLGILVIN